MSDSPVADAFAYFIKNHQKIEDSRNDISQKIGRVILESNSLQMNFFLWFNELTKFDFEVAKKLWDSSTNDHKQRQMLKSIKEGCQNPDIESALDWAIKSSDYLAPYRNAYAHSYFSIDKDSYKLTPDNSFSEPKHLNRINLIDKNDLYENLILEYRAIQFYIMDLLKAYDQSKLLIKTPSADPKVSLPHKPELQLAQRLDHYNNGKHTKK